MIPIYAASLPSINKIKSLAPKIAKAAQAVYDKWDEEDRDTYAGGGICHLIADSIVDLLYSARIECQTVSSSYEQHVYTVAKVKEGVYSVDIPHSLYENGGGFSWTKIPDVEFDPRDVELYRIDGDPKSYPQYVDES